MDEKRRPDFAESLSATERNREVRKLWADSAADYGNLARELPSYVQTNRLLVKVMDLRPGDRVLDLACGAGATLAEAFAQQPELAEAWAIDWVEEMTVQVERQLAQYPIRTGVASAQSFSHLLRGRQFNRVLCNSAFFQFEHPERVLDEVARVLTGDGKMGFTLPGPSNAEYFIELFHRFGLSRPLVGGPQGPGSSLADRCNMDNVDDILRRAKWRLQQIQSITVESSNEEYISWLNLPVFRRPEWSSLDPEDLKAKLRAALKNSSQAPIVTWLVVVASPPP